MMVVGGKGMMGILNSDENWCALYAILMGQRHHSSHLSNPSISLRVFSRMDAPSAFTSIFIPFTYFSGLTIFDTHQVFILQISPGSNRLFTFFGSLWIFHDFFHYLQFPDPPQLVLEGKNRKRGILLHPSPESPRV